MKKLKQHDVVVDRHSLVVEAITVMKQGQFGLTAIKVELEAQLNRGSSGGEETVCPECDGDWEGSCCDSCDDGTFNCDTCEGSGRHQNAACRDCDGQGYTYCEDCGGRYEGYYADCGYCEEGYVYDEYSDEETFGNERYCQDWILERLQPLGLSELVDGHYVVKQPLVYAKFYNDHSVDSELTFTLSMDKPRNVLLLPKITQVFKEFCNEAGSDFNISGAGMHMALLNTPDCQYPTTNVSDTRMQQFRNFRKSMQLLIPALFFLGSVNENSRGLRYRRPMIENGHGNGEGKYCAISYRGGALEFRVFDTCYDNPEALLDNVVVMKNCMRYWRRKYINPNMDKVALNKHVAFGLDGSDKLDRFYITREHIDLLNKGLEKLKPAYYTIKDVKGQRNFCVTKTHINNRVKTVRKEAEIEYKEYENRFSWSMVYQRSQIMANRLNQYTGVPVEEQPLIIEQLTKEVEQEVESLAKTKKPLAQYVEEKVNRLQNIRAGDYTLGVS